MPVPCAYALALALLCTAFPNQAVASPSAPTVLSSAPPIQRSKGRTTGLSLPRFASLRADTINLRRGPGTRYPIDWVLHRRHLPIVIVQEFHFWREIRLPDGTNGWVHQSMLSPRRSFVIGGTRKSLRREPIATADMVAMLRTGVVGHIQTCEAGELWCRVEVGEYAGFLKRTDIWGIDPDEAVRN